MIWRWPLVLAALTVFGLGAALVGEDGPWRWAAWAGLGIPLGVLIRKVFASAA